LTKTPRPRRAADIPIEPASAVAPSPNEVVLHDPALPERARDWWLAADWTALCSIEHSAVSNHPQRAYLAALRAAAWLQRADHRSARQEAMQALAWGYPTELLGRLLVAGARHTLARASWLARRESHAEALFVQSLASTRQSSEVRRHVQARIDQVAQRFQDEQHAATALRQRGTRPAALTAPAWLTGLAEQCLAAPDLHESTDHALANELPLPDDRVQFLMLLADRMQARGDRLSAVHFLHSARWHLDGASLALRGQLANKLVALGATDSALDLAMQAALGDATTPSLTPTAASALAEAYRRLRDGGDSATTKHGQELLLAYLKQHVERLKGLAGERRLTVIEIGTTREDVPGQGSTRELAEFCLQQDLHFVTVDMDPHNTRMARDLFARLEADFDAVTMKGEDFLRERTGSIDFVFLDAYDFDHGKHSALRQSRYEKYLGGRIDEQACHRMHLDCAQSLAAKLWVHGVVCMDDTWRDGDEWTAKGTLAMPYLLENGFTLIEARNRAALLARTRPAPS
jgi:hypothetical protein